MKVVIFWRRRNEFKWQIVDAGTIVGSGLEASVEAARAAAQEAIQQIKNELSR